jgi:CNT family concentrative nucleoside transporter
MTSGMATIAGTVLGAYIEFLGGNDVQAKIMFANHLLTASIIAAPGAIAFAKLIYPEQADQMNEPVIRNERKNHLLETITQGARQGLKVAANVAIMLIVFISFMHLFNFIAKQIGEWASLNQNIASITDGRYEALSLQFLLGYLFAPIMWIIGIAPDDITLVGSLLGEKIIMNEFIGYMSLTELKEAGAFASQSSVIMATYILCGFANFGSIGMQIGGISVLAPKKRSTIAKLGLKALIAGNLTSLLSAAIVGMMIA